MGYTGTEVPIPIGTLGLRTDEAQTNLPPNALIKANNVALYSGRIEKVRGTTKYNSTALTDAVVAIYDWWPTPSLQRLIAVCADGEVYRDTGDGTFSSGVAIGSIGSSPTLTNVTHITEGGSESAGLDKHLFIFTDADQIQVIDADGSTLSDLSGPSADWAAGNYPTFGLVYQGRLCVMGSAADRHRLYFSTATNHEDFTTGSPPTFSVFPGEGDGIKCAAIYRGLLFIFKEPYGVYILDGRNPTTTNWTVSRYSDSFGVSSPHAILQILTDLVAANSFGSYTSLQASDSFGDFEAGDVLSNNLVEDYIRSQFATTGISTSQAIYYPERKLAYFTAHSSTTSGPDRMLILDASRGQLKILMDTKEVPNCLALRRDSSRIQRPMYGSTDGHIYLMDQSTYNVDGEAFLGEFQTVYTDFSFAGSELAGKNKIFDFLQVNFIPTGNNDFYIDVYIDGELRQTLTFTQYYGAALDSFELDVDSLSGDPAGNRQRQPLKSCVGNKISFRVYNNNFNEAFKVERLIVGFRISDEKVYSFQK